MRPATIVRRQIISSPFSLGAVAIFIWFYWKASVINQYTFAEWGLYFVLALLTWEPVAVWLREGARWIPAGELFFLAHLQYYVAPFVNGKEEILTIQSDLRLKTGLVLIAYLLSCRAGYSMFRALAARPRWGKLEILDRDLDFGPQKTVVWCGLFFWTLFSVGTQQGWLPDLGANFNLVRTMFSSAGTLSIFILFYELGANRLKRLEKYVLIWVTLLCLTWSISSGFLANATLQAAVALVAYSIGGKKIPIPTVALIIAILAFLHVGKGEMRNQFWEDGRNYRTQESSILDVYEFWVTSSWERLTDPEAAEKKLPSIFDRGSLLQYVSRIVSETPETKPYLNGKTYLDSLANFVPRFLWPDKPAANAANDYLSIYYEFQSTDQTLSTAIGMGPIGEAWANLGWSGIILIGSLMGLIICIPSALSLNAGPFQFRFLFSIPFILYTISLETVFGQGIQSLLQGLFASFVCLFLVSKSSKPPQPVLRSNTVRPAPETNEAYFIQ